MHIPTLRRSLLVLLATLLYFAVYVAPQLAEHYRALVAPAQDLWLHEASMLLMAFVQAYCILFALTTSRFTLFALMPLLWGFSGLAGYMVGTFHVQVARDSIAAFMEATSGEAKTFVNYDFLQPVVIGLLLGGAVAAALFVCRKKEPNNAKAAAVAGIFALLCIMQAASGENYPPYNFLGASYAYALERAHNYFSTRFDIASLPSSWNDKNNAPVIVMVIGESARADHFSLNGYTRDTDPLLARRSHLVDFPHTTSCGVFTRVSVPCMLTRITHRHTDRIGVESSIISVMRKLGFYTAWFGAQGWFSAADPTTPIVNEANEHTLLSDRAFANNSVLDENLLPLLDRTLERRPPLFIVLHTLGSHWQYAARYPKKFERYTPTCGITIASTGTIEGQSEEARACTNRLQGLINAYDNSILYTDYILDQVIARLVQRDALFVYVSDHGESLGEGGRFLHGHMDAPENYQVPMFWWASDRFIAAHPVQWKALTEKAKNKVSQDNIFPSLLDCIGVKSELVDKKLSLCH